MLLYTYNWGEIATWILITLSIITVVVLLYRRLLMKFNQDNLNTAAYCVLYSLDKEEVQGEVEIYFTTDISRKAKIVLLNDELKEVLVIQEGEFTKGGNIVRFDSTKVENGQYYYALVTDNQKTTKKIQVKNA